MPGYRCDGCGEMLHGWGDSDVCPECGGKLLPMGKNEMEEREEHVIFVRDYLQTHIARSEGRTASATAGREAAARALARKLFGHLLFTLDRINYYTFLARDRSPSGMPIETNCRCTCQSREKEAAT